MKRVVVCLFACVAVAGTGWLAHAVWGQAPESKERSITYTESQWKALLEKAIAADREKFGRGAGASVTDDQVLRGENWHRAVFNKAEWVVYTGPGQAMFHHWIEPKSPPSKGGAGPSAPAGKAAAPTGK